MAIALFEYCLAVPANRLGYVQFSGFQLKIIQEVITISVFIVFAIFFLKEKRARNYIVSGRRQERKFNQSRPRRVPLEAC